LQRQGGAGEFAGIAGFGHGDALLAALADIDPQRRRRPDRGVAEADGKVIFPVAERPRIARGIHLADTIADAALALGSALVLGTRRGRHARDPVDLHAARKHLCCLVDEALERSIRHG
jgi:hypothetical protein